jgi:hypothetical protein
VPLGGAGENSSTHQWFMKVEMRGEDFGQSAMFRYVTLS